MIDVRAGAGTRNFAREEAMSAAELEGCLGAGRRLAAGAAEEGYDLVCLGDMGIGNTSAAAALCLAAGLPGEVIDRGTGIDEAALAHKSRVIAEAVSRHAPFAGPEDMMRKVGGFELAVMTGLILGLADRRIACVLDGFPVSAAALMAARMDPSCTGRLFAGHKSRVRGHALVLEELGLVPLADLDMRLGEGTGAVLGGRLIELAALLSAEMASFTGAGVSRSEGDEEDY